MLKEPALEDAKSEFPEELSRNVVRLTCDSTAEGGKCDVYVVGTCHVLEESAIQVKAIINLLKPEAVFIELCDERANVLTCKTLKDFLKKKTNHPNFLAEALTDLYAKLGKQLGVVPGSEFRAAYEEANKYNGKVILGDRPNHITLKRGWGKMSPWHKTKFVCFSLLLKGIFSLKLVGKHNVREMIEKMMNEDPNIQKRGMSKSFPTLDKVILDERDQYMSSGLFEVARNHNSVVAVVGQSHLSGIQKYWKKPIIIEDLLELPQPRTQFMICCYGSIN